MKQTLRVKLAPSPADHAALLRTLQTCNAACNASAEVAYEQRVANPLRLQPLVYYDIRQQFGRSSQRAIRAIAPVSESYKRDRSSKPTWRLHGAMTYDQRICSFPSPDRVSLLTLDGRVAVPFRCGAYAEGMLQRPRGQCDRLYRKRSDTGFLAIRVDAPEPTPDEASEYLGVDLGVISLAATSDGGCLKPCHRPPPRPQQSGPCALQPLPPKAPDEGQQIGQAPQAEAQWARAAVGARHQPLYPQGHRADGQRHLARGCA